MEDISKEGIHKHEKAKISTRKDKRKVENCPEESLLHSKKLKGIFATPSNEVDDCTKMMDEIQDLLKNIESLKNLKPPRDIEDVKNDILLHKSRIRDLIKDLDSSFASGKLPFDSKGGVEFKNIFCYKCPSKRMAKDNIFILCKGGCERAFHQSCLEPSLSTPRVRSWICYGCNCKARCFDLFQKYHKTEFSTADSWEKVFPEAKEYRRDSKDDDDDYISDEKKENVSPTIDVQPSEFKDFEFKDENFDLPMDVKTKYRALCYSLKMLPHDNVPEKIHRDLVRGMIIQITEIVDQIKASRLAIASLDDLQFWKTILEALATLGMDVGILLARIDSLMKHLIEYQANKNKGTRLISEIEVQKQLYREKLEEIKAIEGSVDTLVVDILPNNAKLDFEFSKYREKLEEIKAIKGSIDTLVDEFVDILPNNAKHNFEFSKDAKEGMGQYDCLGLLKINL